MDSVLKAYMVAKPDQKDIMMSYLIAGARKSEILKWEWSDIDFKNRVYALHTRKTGTGEIKTTNHEMPDALYNILMRRFENRHPTLPYVFWHRFWDRREGTWREDRYQNISKFCQRLCKRAKVPKFTLHQLRHLDTSVLKEEGNMGLAKLQRFLRHDKQRTTEIYAGHLEKGTKEQTSFLADFWSQKIEKEAVTSNSASNPKKKKGKRSR
jgi:integrase